jgi:hypothetical protein
MAKAGTRKTVRTMSKKSSTKSGAGNARRKPRPTIAKLNAWITSRHDELLAAATKNCIRLTGKPTFGGTSRRKSA